MSKVKFQKKKNSFYDLEKEEEKMHSLLKTTNVR